MCYRTCVINIVFYGGNVMCYRTCVINTAFNGGNVMCYRTREINTAFNGGNVMLQDMCNKHCIQWRGCNVTGHV